MMIPTSLLVGCAVVGLAIALLLWWLGVVAWWAIPLVAVLAPAAVFLAIVGTLYGLWIVSGSH
ncbi:MAG: hypothetical protein V4595_09240 [Pseudomonadota bacterium]|jgi:hypothetical protein